MHVHESITTYACDAADAGANVPFWALNVSLLSMDIKNILICVKNNEVT